MKKTTFISLVLCLSGILTLTGCGYLQMCVQRQRLQTAMEKRPLQTTSRELNGTANCLIYGRVVSTKPMNKPVAIAAISYRFGKQEIVATSFLCGVGYYSLTLPAGQYQLLAFVDTNADKILSSAECIGYYQDKAYPFITVAPPTANNFVQTADIMIGSMVFSIDQPIAIEFPLDISCNRSSPYDFLSYPPEVIRSLDDTLFSAEMSELGIYSPARFIAKSGMYFYTPYNWNESKTPVLFVHGYGGSPREFRYLCEQLDTSRYSPVFFHYPSGQSLTQTAQILYEVYFSGRVVDIHEKPYLCIAHSMGGLVARRAINLYCEHTKAPLKPVTFISLCSPCDGVEAAKSSLERAPELIDSWQDIAHDSPFLQALHKDRLPAAVNFYLLFGYKYPKRIQVADNSDGTIALSSQLFAPAQQCAAQVYGFNESHESILTSSAAAVHITSLLGKYGTLR